MNLVLVDGHKKYTNRIHSITGIGEPDSNQRRMTIYCKLELDLIVKDKQRLYIVGGAYDEPVRFVPSVISHIKPSHLIDPYYTLEGIVEYNSEPVDDIDNFELYDILESMNKL